MAPESGVGMHPEYAHYPAMYALHQLVAALPRWLCPPTVVEEMLLVIYSRSWNYCEIVQSQLPNLEVLLTMSDEDTTSRKTKKVYGVLYTVVVGCAISQIVTTLKQLPFCPGAREPFPRMCNKQHSYLIFTPTWTFIMVISSVMHWCFARKLSEEGASREVLVYFGIRMFCTLVFWIGSLAVAAAIKDIFGIVFGSVVLPLYMYLFLVERVKAGIPTDGSTWLILWQISSSAGRAVHDSGTSEAFHNGIDSIRATLWQASSKAGKVIHGGFESSWQMLCRVSSVFYGGIRVAKRRLMEGKRDMNSDLEGKQPRRPIRELRPEDTRQTVGFRNIGMFNPTRT